MSQRLWIGTMIALMGVPTWSQAEPCAGRCVKVEQGASAAAKLTGAKRPGLTLVHVDELGLVEGTEIDGMIDECSRRALVAPPNGADVRGLLVDFISLYPVGEFKAVIDYQLKRSCAGGN